MIFFTSDLHFGHSNIVRMCDRPFATIEEMDEQLIRNWNRKVHKCDTVYILGDFIFRIGKRHFYMLLYSLICYYTVLNRTKSCTLVHAFSHNLL